MRVALISDIHGNEIALRAVLESIAREGVDRIVCLGDVATLGPRPGAVLALLRDMGCPCIAGNHDDFMLRPDLVHGYAKVPIVIDGVDWCRGELSSADLDQIRAFVPELESRSTAPRSASSTAPRARTSRTCSRPRPRTSSARCSTAAARR